MKVDLKLNIRAACLFEKLSGKSFYNIGSPEDILILTYACYIAANEKQISLKTFVGLLDNNNFKRAILEKYKEISNFNDQFKENLEQEKEGLKEENKNEEDEITISDIAAILVINNGLNPEYVYDKMQFYEIPDYFKWSTKKFRMEEEEKRLWTFLNVTPIYAFMGAGKQLKSPDKLLKFPWEMDAAQKDLINKQDFVKQMFETIKAHNKQIEEQNNGTGFNSEAGCEGPEKDKVSPGEDGEH